MSANNPMDYQLHHLGNKVQKIVFMLHGYGSNGSDLLTLAPDLGDDNDNTLFVSPNGCQTFEGGLWGCFQWYSLIDRHEEAMFKGGQLAADKVQSLIEKIVNQYKVDWQNVYILGFSQGCALTLHLSYRLPHKIGGVIGICGRLNMPQRLKGELKHKPNTILIHGKEDNVVPPIAMQIAADALTACGVEVTTHLRPKLAHGIDEETVRLVKEFIT